MSQVAAELGISQIGLNLNHGWVRALAGQNSGPVNMSNLQGQTGTGLFSGNATTGPVYAFDFSISWFRGTTQSISYSGVPGDPTVLKFQNAPNWSSNILVKNLSAGLSATFTKQDSLTWVLSGGILRSGSTDNFSMQPA